MPVLVPHTQIHSQKLLRHLYAKLALKPKHYTADCSLSYDLSRYKWGEHNVGNKVQSITALKGWESLCIRICDWALWWCPERASWRFSRTSYLHFSQWESGPVSLPRQPPHLTINSSLDAAYVPATAPSLPYFSEYYNISFTSPYCTILFWLHLSLSLPYRCPIQYYHYYIFLLWALLATLPCSALNCTWIIRSFELMTDFWSLTRLLE